MIKREQKFLTELQKWMLYNWKESCKIEGKVSIDNKPFNLKSGFKPHQLPTLINIKNGPFSFKPSDLAQLQQPYDIDFSYKQKAYVAIMWIRKCNKTFYLIDPVAIQGLQEDGHKSIDEKMAHVIAEYVGELK